MKRNALLGIFSALILVLVVGVTTQAQMPKQGKYRGMFSAWSAGTTNEIEQGHVFSWERSLACSLTTSLTASSTRAR